MNGRPTIELSLSISATVTVEVGIDDMPHTDEEATELASAALSDTYPGRSIEYFRCNLADIEVNAGPLVKES